jgi:hypothetical protein
MIKNELQVSYSFLALGGRSLFGRYTFGSAYCWVIARNTCTLEFSFNTSNYFGLFEIEKMIFKNKIKIRPMFRPPKRSYLGKIKLRIIFLGR